MAEGISTKLLITDGKKFRKIVDKSAPEVQLPTGILSNEQLNSMPPGSSFTINQRKYFLFICTLDDFIDKKLDRKTQIMYPKEIGYMVYKLDINAGDSVGEAGTGSGAMTLSLSRIVGETGFVYTYEERTDFVKNIKKNLTRGQRFDNIVFYNQSILDGIHQSDLDAFVLDVREPWEVLDKVYEALRPSGNLGILVPTYNQVSDTIPALKEHNFYLSEIVELMMRRYKHNPDRLRPEDIMIGHTGYLILAKKMLTDEYNIE